MKDETSKLLTRIKELALKLDNKTKELDQNIELLHQTEKESEEKIDEAETRLKHKTEEFD